MNTTSKKRPIKFVIVGVINTLIDFAVYTLASATFFSHNLTFATILSGTVATVTAYILHKNITWKDKVTSKSTVIEFIIVNAIGTLLIRPLVMALLTRLTPVYQFAFSISSGLKLPFDYSFVENTSIFVLLTAVILTVNYIAYSKIVFTKDKKTA
jgi:Predicted membrane protein